MLKGTESFSPEDIAREIVTLESKLPKFEEAVREAEKAARGAIQAKIGGGNISKAEVDSATKNLEEARLSLDAVQDGLANLQIKLKNIVHNARETELAKIIEERRVMVKEKATFPERINLVKAIALLTICREALEGDRACDNQTLHVLQELYQFSPDEKDSFNSEIDRLRSQLLRPTFFEKRSNLDKREVNVRISVQEQIELLMRKARESLVEVN